jgi:hypothetical protein
VVLFVQFALVWRFQLTVSGLLSLFGSVTFFLIFLGDRRETADRTWPRWVVSLVGLLTVGVTALVIVQLLVLYVL